MRNFLLELLVEEIPAKMQRQAISDFENLIVEKFTALKIPYQNVHSSITPRRIIFSADLEENTEAFTEEKKGPAITAAPEIIDRFLLANNIDRGSCTEKVEGKKTFIYAQVQHQSQRTASLLESVVTAAIKELSWKKSMHWGTHQFHFVRPIRNILALFGEELLPINFDEIGLHSTTKTFGHRFMAPDAINVRDFSDYCEKMKNAFVIINQEERRKIILKEIAKLEKEHGFKVVVTDDLLEELSGLVEYPVVLVGKVPARFMRLPEEAIITPMRVHQRYFPTRTADGKLAPYFVFVANNLATDGGAMIIAGNERVLNARLADALFFYETDLKKPLESYSGNLKKIVFHKELGSVYNRVQRVKALCNFACSHMIEKNTSINEATSEVLERAAILAKCDLSTSMVCEFTELQGIMGSYYAKEQGEKDSVCTIIREQYNLGDNVSSVESALFSLVDKVELITSFFAINKEPTGSKDPFALRRAAIGVIKIIEKYDFSIDLAEVVSFAFSQLPAGSLNPDTVSRVIDFIKNRLKTILKDSEIDHDVVVELLNTEEDIRAISQKAAILNDVLKTPMGNSLMTVYKRAKSIAEGNQSDEVDEPLLIESEEKHLFNELNRIISKLYEISQSSADEKSKFTKKLELCESVSDSVANFFDKILVNDSREEIKTNRLRLLTRLVKTLRTVIPMD